MCTYHNDRNCLNQVLTLGRPTKFLFSQLFIYINILEAVDIYARDEIEIIGDKMFET